MAVPRWVWVTAAVIVGLLAVIAVAAAVQAGVYAGQDTEAKARLGVPPSVPLRTLREHPALYDVLRRTLEALAAARIEAWACAGTALGIERHGDVIPWDDDADLCMWQADVARLREVPWAKYGLGLHPYPLGFQTYALSANGGHGASVDLFAVHEVADGSVEYAEPLTRFAWPRERFDSKREIHPLVARRFGPLQVPTAAGNRTYVQRAFSRACLSEARFQPPHLLPLWERLLITVNPWIPKAWPIKA